MCIHIICEKSGLNLKENPHKISEHTNNKKSVIVAAAKGIMLVLYSKIEAPFLIFDVA